MPYSMVLHCIATNGALHPDDLQGQKALALFLEDLIQRQDPSAAARLHAPRHTKAFTTGLLPSRPEAAASHQRPHGTPAEVDIRLTLLDDTLYPLVSQFFLRHLDHLPLLRLGQTALQVARVLATPASGEPWAGFTRFEDLLAMASTTATSWSLHFATPTAFKAGEAELPLPIPRLCFQSWLSSWEAHAPQPFFPDKDARRAFLTNLVEGNVSVTYSQLRVVQRRFFFDGTQTREQGFLGTCRFAVRPSKVSPPFRQILDTLARYSFYAGTGRKTTMGMGMTRRLEQEEPACQIT